VEAPSTQPSWSRQLAGLTATATWIHDRPVSRGNTLFEPKDGSFLAGGQPRLAKGEALELILRELREEILDGRLRPGERIHQQAFAERFGTSRLPVREALRQLQSEGLVVVSPNAGARVARLDADEFDEVYLLRGRLEPLAVERGAANLTDEQLAFLGAEVEAMEAFGEVSGSESEWLARDRAFHLGTFAATHSPRLLSIIESLWNVAEPYRRAYLGLHPEIVTLTLVEHRLLFDALTRRDGEDAARVLEMHIRRTRLGLTRHPEIFDS
jgi:DNA-binding GntR family transcriptional regulator